MSKHRYVTRDYDKGVERVERGCPSLIKHTAIVEVDGKPKALTLKDIPLRVLESIRTIGPTEGGPAEEPETGIVWTKLPKGSGITVHYDINESPTGEQEG